MVDKGEGKGREKFGVVEEGAMVGYINNEMLATERRRDGRFQSSEGALLRLSVLVNLQRLKTGKTWLDIVENKTAVKRNITNGSLCAPPN